MFSWVAATPFGRPVVPEVNRTWASSCRVTETSGNSWLPFSSSASERLQPLQPATGCSLITPTAPALDWAQRTCSSPWLDRTGTAVAPALVIAA